MMLSPRTQATLLLTLRLGASGSGNARPLEPREWHRFVGWLTHHGLRPEDLLTGDIRNILAQDDDLHLDHHRVLTLLDRTVPIEHTVKRWSQAGIWVLDGLDPEYPGRLLHHLAHTTPPLLFGYGPRPLLKQGGIAIVGARDSTPDEMALAEDLGRRVSAAGHTVISGGARGIDEHAMHGALLSQGAVVAVLGDSLLRAVRKKQYRAHLDANHLTLLTPTSPDAGFSAGNAMGRNRLIYCLADAAIVVSAHDGYGGTFRGATEALHHGWIPVWVRRNNDETSGNNRLLQMGAHDYASADDQALRPVIAVADADAPPSPAPLTKAATPEARDGHALFDHFLEAWRQLGPGPLTVRQLADLLDLTTQQVTVWADLATNRGIARKTLKPRRYELLSTAPITEDEDSPTIWKLRFLQESTARYSERDQEP